MCMGGEGDKNEVGEGVRGEVKQVGAGMGWGKDGVRGWGGDGVSVGRMRVGWGAGWIRIGLGNSTLIPSSPLEEIRRVVDPDHQLGSRTPTLSSQQTHFSPA